MKDVVGLHLVAHVDLVDSPRPSVVARLDASARLHTLEHAGGDEQIVDLVAARSPGLVVVDAPLAVPNTEGRRDVEAVLAWCDIPAFPVSARRMEKVFGGARGVDLARALGGSGMRAVEALPDQVLRQIAWESQGSDDGPLDLAHYRSAWPRVRAPRYRPKGLGRARVEGIRAAWRSLATVVNMNDWRPTEDPDDWTAIGDAACIDAICCAYAGLRLMQGTGLSVGTPARGEVALPVDANLSERLVMTLERLRSEGAIVI